MTDVMKGVWQFLTDHGYDVKPVMGVALALSVSRGNKFVKLFLHFEDDWLSLETPLEMGIQGKKHRDCFKNSVCLSTPDCLDVILDWLCKYPECLE